MAENTNQQQYAQAYEQITDVSVKLRDIEEKQNILKDRVLLIGENLVTSKETTESEINELRLKAFELEEEIKRLKINMQTLLEATGSFVRKNEFDILKRQFQMFQPLEFARISDIESIIKKMLKNSK